MSSPIDKLHVAYSKWLEIKEDVQALDVILSALLDRKLLGDPLWLFVVGPSSTGKSELLRSLYRLSQVKFLSNLTSKTIVSGKALKGKQIVKGIHAQMNGKVVIIPELSEVLTKFREERDQIFSQLRNLYDGELEVGFGTTDEILSVKCRIGLICGVTSVIDVYGSIHAQLGERFLKVRPKFERNKVRVKAWGNRTQLEAMRKELSTATEKFLSELEIIPDLRCSDDQGEFLGRFAEFVALLRTPVTPMSSRETDSSEWLPETEFASRLVQQFDKLAACHATIYERKKIDQSDLDVVSRVAADTCLPSRLGVVRELYLADGPMNISQIAGSTLRRANEQKKKNEKPNIVLPWHKVRNSLDSLVSITGIVQEDNSDFEYNARAYRLTEEFRKLVDSITPKEAEKEKAKEPEKK